MQVLHEITFSDKKAEQERLAAEARMEELAKKQMG